MKSEKMYLIHEDDYLRHIKEKTALYSMVRQLAFAVHALPDCPPNHSVRNFADRCAVETDEMFKTWGIPRSYLKSGDPDELCDLMENELIEPEDAGYYADEDDDYLTDVYDFDDDEYDTDKIRELLGISNTILKAAQRLNDIIEDEIDYGD